MFPFFTMVLFLQIRTCSCKFCFHHSLPTGLRKKFYNHISNNQSHDLDLQNSKKQNREREKNKCTGTASRHLYCHFTKEKQINRNRLLTDLTGCLSESLKPKCVILHAHIWQATLQ